ncbi:MAG: PLP-dependent aminotransferase family protein [Pseudomonadota bacterium]
MDTIWAPKLRDALSDARGAKYRLLANAIETAIEKGVFAVGDKLPPVRDLAYRLSITPGTVARAYAILTNSGLLEAGVGRGTFVAAKDAQAPEVTDDTQDFWEQSLVRQDSSVAVLSSPYLPDVGQVARLRSLLKQVADGPAERLMLYPSRQGFRPVREAVANWIGDALLGPLDEKDIVLAHGGQNAILLVMQTVLRGPTPQIFVEDLSYPGFRRAAETLRAETVALPMDDQGMLPEALDRAARSDCAQLVCLTPEVQNPTCGFMPPERREALARVIKARDLQVLEDDCYRLATPQGPSFRTLAPDRGWYVASISKSLTPALRVGFGVAPQGRGGELSRAAVYGFFGLAQPLAELARVFLASTDAQRMATAVQSEFARYIEVAVNHLGRYDIAWRRDVPFLWLSLPAGWRAASFCREAESQGVLIRSADEFVLRDGRAPNAVRIAVNAQISLSSFEAAMVKLVNLLDEPPEQISV